MKKIKFLYPAFLLLPFVCIAQAKVDSLIERGNQLHDKGQFDEALNLYNDALKFDPQSTFALVEIGNTYLAVKDYEKAVSYSNRVINLNKGNLILAYMVKGTALDHLDKSEESVAAYIEGLAKGGNHYLLHYNLGLVYHKTKEFGKAEECFINAISLNPNHSSSHLVLGTMMDDQNKKSKAVLAYFYFLLLEPNSDRAKTIYSNLMKTLTGSPNTIVVAQKDNENDGFDAVDLALGLLASSRPKELTADVDVLDFSTQTFFNIANELKKEHAGFWWNFYVPFFYKINKANQNRVFGYFISQGLSAESSIWIKSNNDKVTGFINVLKNN